MDEHGLARPPGQGQLGPERARLGVAGREIAKEIEAVSPIATTRGAAASRSISASWAGSARPASWG